MCDQMQTIGFDFDGAFAEYMLIPSLAFENRNLNKLPETISDEEAALAEPIACCINAQEYLQIQKGDIVLIFGAGFIGYIHAEIAKMKGASKVITAETMENRVQQAKEILTDVTVINLEEENLDEIVWDYSKGKGSDITITACPSGEAQKQALKLTAKRGKISLFEGLPGESQGF